MLPGILYCGHSAAYAQYNACTSGDYHAEILHLYENFSYSLSHPALKPQILLAEHNFSIQATHHVSVGHPQCGPALLADGRWVVSHKLSRAFHTTCVTESRSFDACSKAVRILSRDTDDALLHWQPHLCSRLAREQDLDIRACLDKRRICFSGDSQMRHAYNGFVALSEGGGRAHEYWQDWDFNKLIGKSAFSSYQFDAWAQELATDNCSVIFVNVGQVRPSCHRLGPTYCTVRCKADSNKGLVRSGLPALRVEAAHGLLASTSIRQASLQPNLRMQKAKAQLPIGYVAYSQTCIAYWS